MELSDILNSLSDDSTSGEFSKTASDSSTDALSNAIDRALHSGLTKEASHTASPSTDLVKMASRIADAENLSLVKEAEVYGAAVADGFMARMGTSSRPQYDNTDSIKVAFDQGYADTIAALSQEQSYGMDKVAAHQEAEMIKAAAFEEGYNDMIKEAAFEEGYNDTIKEAAFEEGYNDMIKEAAHLEKTAAVFEDYGYNYGNQILASL
jgi:hypothetical protein